MNLKNKKKYHSILYTSLDMRANFRGDPPFYGRDLKVGGHNLAIRVHKRHMTFDHMKDGTTRVALPKSLDV